MSTSPATSRTGTHSTVWVDKEVLKHLKVQAASRGVTVQYLVEKALLQWARRQDREAQRRYARACQRAG